MASSAAALLICGACLVNAAPAPRQGEDAGEGKPVTMVTKKPVFGNKIRSTHGRVDPAQSLIQHELERLAKQGSVKIHGWDRPENNAIPAVRPVAVAPPGGRQPSMVAPLTGSRNKPQVSNTNRLDGLPADVNFPFSPNVANILQENNMVSRPLYTLDRLMSRMRIRDMIRQKVTLDQLIEAMMEDYYITYGPGADQGLSNADTDEILDFLARAIYENAELPEEGTSPVPMMSDLGNLFPVLPLESMPPDQQRPLAVDRQTALVRNTGSTDNQKTVSAANSVVIRQAPVQNPAMVPPVDLVPVPAVRAWQPPLLRANPAPTGGNWWQPPPTIRRGAWQPGLWQPTDTGGNDWANVPAFSILNPVPLGLQDGAQEVPPRGNAPSVAVAKQQGNEAPPAVTENPSLKGTKTITEKPA